ncbi:hypothetical protein HVX40_24155 (plasmid) [Escherichia coli]|nr:hypothetical protein [Escherichia coli]ELD1608929.1 hypothetical protein [Escherichia coli]MBA8354097.1 hypothetical protein [Escherichia coli]
MTRKTDLSKIPSISGKNGYSLRCMEVQINGTSAFCSYTVCQHTVLAYKEKRLPVSSFISCSKAISAGKCSALKMMVEEIRAGKSLYFIDMVAQIDELEKRNRTRTPTRSYGGLKIHKKTESTSSNSSKPVTDVYAALVEAVTNENT